MRTERHVLREERGQGETDIADGLCTVKTCDPYVCGQVWTSLKSEM